MKYKHPHLHHALWALHYANLELKESKEEFNGHKQKAHQAINAAITHIEVILKYENDDARAIPSKGQLTEALVKKYKHYPYLHHALHEVKSAHHQLKVSQNDFGGHRMKALRETNHAIHQIELVLKHAKQVDKTAAK